MSTNLPHSIVDNLSVFCVVVLLEMVLQTLLVLLEKKVFFVLHHTDSQRPFINGDSSAAIQEELWTNASPTLPASMMVSSEECCMKMPPTCHPQFLRPLAPLLRHSFDRTAARCCS